MFQRYRIKVTHFLKMDVSCYLGSGFFCTPYILFFVGVYTKNRNFRLYLSSKLNKNTTLKLANENHYPSFSNDEIDHKTIFFDSLVANVQ